MITGELKNKTDSLWKFFLTGRHTNPLDVMERITYMIYIHSLNETDNIHAKA